MMPVEIRLLAFSVLLGAVHIIAASASGLQQRGGLGWAAGPRDGPTPQVTGVAARLERASKNFLETFPFFAAVVLAAVAIDRHNTGVVYGAYLYFFGRLAYLPASMVSIPYVRTLAWGVAMVGIAFAYVGLFTKITPFI